MGEPRYGLFSDITGLDELAADLQAADADGLDSYWVTQGFGHDALTALAASCRGLRRLRVGTAVVPVQPRHPMALAQQALTTQLVTGGRLVLGVGPSHPQVVGPCWGLSYERPARLVGEYLEALLGALTQHVRFRGETVTARGDLTVATDLPPPPVMLAALGPAMLRLAGARAAGTITWLVGPRTLRTLTLPTLARAAEAADRPVPEVVVTVPVWVTDRPAEARTRLAETLSWYDDKPSYRAMLDREGAASAVDLALIGSTDRVREGLARLHAAGATTLALQLHGSGDELDRGRALLTELARDRDAAR